jgi:hypothetical protein
MHAQLVELVKERMSLEIRIESLYGKEGFVTAWPPKQSDVVPTYAF